MIKKYPYKEAAGMLKIIAHPVRLNIITLLDRKRMSVNEICAAAGAKQSITSQHLNAMADKGILRREREENRVYYSIKKKEVFNILKCIKGCCNKRK
ncbi:MAG: metalloregulator ArsR/SmtB family transcription factor [Candidatus Omnitrophica bacterium]|nr:metalloregulator ArsR/SmtB family transcription factor [Candidatus Omnitrophota bacterium]